jgi:hypothetical protein
MIFRLSRTRKSAGAPKPKDRLLPRGLREIYRRLQRVNSALLTNHYWEQRSYIAAINMQYAVHAIPVLPEEKIRVHFLHADAMLSPLWDGLFRACVADARLEVKVVWLDAGQSPLAEKFPPDAAFLREQGIACTPYADYDPYAERPHILVYQSPLDEVYLHFARCKANFIKKYGIRPVCLCGPEYDEPEPEARKILYQQYAQMFAWRIVAPYREIKEEFYRHCLPGGDAVLVVEDMDGERMRDGLLQALFEERERLAEAKNNAALHAGLECLARGMAEEG